MGKWERFKPIGYNRATIAVAIILHLQTYDLGGDLKKSKAKPGKIYNTNNPSL